MLAYYCANYDILFTDFKIIYQIDIMVVPTLGQHWTANG